MSKRTLSVLLFSIVFCCTANAGTVRVWGERFSLTTISNFYSGLGHDSAIVSGQLNTIDLTGIELLWAVQPADSYTAAELTTMSTFLSTGGRIAFLGEHGTFAPSENMRINAALTALGSSISINATTVVDSGFRTASKLDGQILTHPLTAGVDRYSYAAFAPLNVGAGGQVLMRGEDDPTTIMMAYQNVGGGSIFLITDQNVWDNPFAENNETMFENLLEASVEPNPIPEPSSILLTLAGAGVLAAVRSRTKKTV